MTQAHGPPAGLDRGVLRGELGADLVQLGLGDHVARGRQQLGVAVALAALVEVAPAERRRAGVCTRRLHDRRGRDDQLGVRLVHVEGVHHRAPVVDVPERRGRRRRLDAALQGVLTVHRRRGHAHLVVRRPRRRLVVVARAVANGDAPTHWCTAARVRLCPDGDGRCTS